MPRAPGLAVVRERRRLGGILGVSDLPATRGSPRRLVEVENQQRARLPRPGLFVFGHSRGHGWNALNKSVVRLGRQLEAPPTLNCLAGLISHHASGSSTENLGRIWCRCRGRRFFPVRPYADPWRDPRTVTWRDRREPSSRLVSVPPPSVLQAPWESGANASNSTEAITSA